MNLTIPITTLLIIFAVLVLADKALTFTNLTLVQKNFPNADALKIERNPVARMFMDKFGFLGGNLIYFVATLISLFLVYLAIIYSGSKIIGIQSYALYGIMLVYGFVIMNNIYFTLKFAKVIP